jgi:mannosyl-glycoprotein endo-beta-N-acetylglucosaminidase
MYDEGYVFEGWDGDCITAEYGPAAVIRMPDRDVTVKIKAKKLGEDILQNKPAKANHEFNSRETADNAVNGNDRTKWCAASEDGKLWLEVDAGEVFKVNEWFVMHGGAVESPGYNTRDFRLEYRVSEDEDWKVADEVKDNRADQTHRGFDAVEGRYFRLWIDRATQGRDPTARIYMFQVFKA